MKQSTRDQYRWRVKHAEAETYDFLVERHGYVRGWMVALPTGRSVGPFRNARAAWEWVWAWIESHPAKVVPS